MGRKSVMTRLTLIKYPRLYTIQSFFAAIKLTLSNKYGALKVIHPVATRSAFKLQWQNRYYAMLREHALVLLYINGRHDKSWVRGEAQRYSLLRYSGRVQ